MISLFEEDDAVFDAGEIVTEAVAYLLLSAREMAETVATVVLLTVGAVKPPDELMVPFDAVQVTALLLVPVRVAANN